MITIEGISEDKRYVYFWLDELDGDARVEGTKVIDVQVNHPSVDLSRNAELQIALKIGDWLEEQFGTEAEPTGHSDCSSGATPS